MYENHFYQYENVKSPMEIHAVTIEVAFKVRLNYYKPISESMAWLLK